MSNVLTRARVAGALLLVLLVTTGVGCAQSVKPRPASSKPLTLKYWRVIDDQDAFDETFKAYRAIHPNVSIEYRKFRLDEYEKELLNALAEDRGPDIMAIHNTWVPAYQSKLLPAPASVTLAFREVQGLNKEPVWVEKTKPVISQSLVKSLFVDQVAKDVVINAPTGEGDKKSLTPQVFGLPLSLDTLALYYNKDVLNAAGVPLPAATWSEFQDHVKRVTQYDEQGKLVRPAAGIGTSKNVDRAFDILSLLMIQNGAQMSDENGYPTFNRTPSNLEREIPPGAEALTFYTDFANPAKEVFTWDDTQPNSFDAFIAGKTAYFLGYAYHLPRIRAQAPKLNVGITNVPQIDPNFRRNYANYWVEGVSKKSKFAAQSWDLVQFLAAEEQAKTFLARTAKPTALRALVNTQLNDADLAPFASQVLTAVSWYRGINVEAAENAFTEMIDAMLGGAEPQKALSLGVDAISQTIR
jgi:multiple sugar transport system substrate-binding protein